MQRSLLFPYGGFPNVLEPVYPHLRYGSLRRVIWDLVGIYNAQMIMILISNKPTSPTPAIVSRLHTAPPDAGWGIQNLMCTTRFLCLITFIALCSCSRSPQAVNRDALDDAITKANFPAARTLLGDPDARFLKAKQDLQLGMQHAATSSMGQASRDAVESIFTDEVIRIIIVLDKTGNHQKAKVIQSEALGLLCNTNIANAITP
jgi:hypothetical protein